jgi:hypothetical protein
MIFYTESEKKMKKMKKEKRKKEKRKKKKVCWKSLLDSFFSPGPKRSRSDEVTMEK